MRFPARRSILLALAALLTTPGHAAAFHEDGLPLLIQREEEGAGWVSLKVDLAPGEKAAVDLEGWGAGRPIQIGAYIYGADDSGPAGFVGTQLAPDSGIFVDAHPAPGIDIRHEGFVENPYQNYLRAGQTVGAPDEEPRTFKWLLWSTGTDRWRVTIRGNPQTPEGQPAVRIAATLEGSETFVHTSKDFTGTLNAQAWGPPGARVAVETSRQVEATDLFVGHYFTIPSLPPTSAGQLSVVKPDGEEVECPCYFRKLSGPDVWGPGTYTFNLTGAGISRESEVVLGGLFARLPV